MVELRLLKYAQISQKSVSNTSWSSILSHSFLLKYQEWPEALQNPPAETSTLSTQTRGREQPEHDRSVLLGTKTSTATREEREQDEGCEGLKFLPRESEVGRTMTEAREEPDCDSFLQKTAYQTMTKMREEPDQRAPVAEFHAIPRG